MHCPRILWPLLMVAGPHAQSPQLGVTQSVCVWGGGGGGGGGGEGGEGRGIIYMYTYAGKRKYPSWPFLLTLMLTSSSPPPMVK